MKKRSKSKLEFQLVLANFRIRAEWKKVTSRAELKIFQLELWLEPSLSYTYLKCDVWKQPKQHMQESEPQIVKTQSLVILGLCLQTSNFK